MTARPSQLVAAQVEIEKLVYGGHGLARLPADEKGRRLAVFVPMVLPSETADIRISPAKGGMTWGEATAILQPSSERVVPGCPFFGVCGGCQLQHGSYELQVRAKRDILRETLNRARLDITLAIGTLIAAPWQYRNRIRLQVRNSPQWECGYLERGSHRMLPIAECPIAAPLLQRTVMALETSAIAKLAPAELREIELFCNQDQTQMTLAAAVNSAARNFTERFEAWCGAIAEATPQLRGCIAVASESQSRGQILAQVDKPWLTYTVANHEYRVSAASFFQVNHLLLPSMVEHVLAAAGNLNSKRVLDLYAGAGLFARAMAAQGSAVIGVEASESSSADLHYNLSGFSNAKAVHATTEDFLARALVDRKAPKPEVILVDPPRSGLGPVVTRQLAQLAAPTLLYLSCDPTTLARDLHPLLAAGYIAEQVTMIDLFPQTFHLETLVTLRHNKRA